MNTLVETTRQEQTRTKSFRNMFLKVTLVLIEILVAAYIGLSMRIADQITQPARQPVFGTPAQYGLAYEAVHFDSAVDHVRLEGWYIPSGSTQAVILLHGLGGVRNGQDNTGLKIAQALAQNQYNVLLFDFRAHGESGGTRFSLGAWEARDVTGAVDYLKSRGMTWIGALGFSMGAVAALNAAPDTPSLCAIVSDSSFADARSLVETQLPGFTGLSSIFIPGSELAARTLYGIDISANRPVVQVARMGSRPVLLIHGAADELVPVADAYALQQAGANDPNFQLWIVPGVGHVGAYARDPTEYLSRVIRFFDHYRGDVHEACP